MAKSYEGVAECVIEDAETLNAAKTRAKQLAEQDARQQAALYIGNFVKDKNFNLSVEEIPAITDAVIKFVDVQYGKAIIQARVAAQFDDNDISAWIRKYSREKTALVNENEELRRKIVELEQKLSGYESKIENIIPNENAIALANKKADTAWKLFCRKDYRGAIELYDEIIRLNPKAAEFYFCRGLCYENLGYKKEAQADFEKSKKLG